MCFTPGSEPARSSSTPSNAPSPSRLASGLQRNVQPAGVPGAPGAGGTGEAVAVRLADGDALAVADADTDADAPEGLTFDDAPPGAAQAAPSRPGAAVSRRAPLSVNRTAAPTSPPSASTAPTTRTSRATPIRRRDIR